MLVTIPTFGASTYLKDPSSVSCTSKKPTTGALTCSFDQSTNKLEVRGLFTSAVGVNIDIAFEISEVYTPISTEPTGDYNIEILDSSERTYLILEGLKAKVSQP